MPKSPFRPAYGTVLKEGTHLALGTEQDWHPKPGVAAALTAEGINPRGISFSNSNTGTTTMNDMRRDERLPPGRLHAIERFLRRNHSPRYGRETKLLPPFQNVIAGGTAFLDLQLGWTYESIGLLYGGTTFDATKMNAIRVIANGQVIHNVTGTIRDIINQLDKLQAATTNKTLMIPFHRTGLRDNGADQMTGLSTLIKCRQAPFGISTLRIEVDIDATAVAPTLTPFAVVRQNDERLSRALLRTETYTETVPATVNAEYRLVKKLMLDSLRPNLQRIGFKQANTEILNYRGAVDSKDIWNRDSKLNETIQTINGLRSPQSGWVWIDTGEDGYSHPLHLADVADHSQYLKLAAGNYVLTFVTETLGSLGAA